MTASAVAAETALSDLILDLLEHTEDWVLCGVEDEVQKLSVIVEILGGEVNPRAVNAATRLLFGLVQRHYPATQLKVVASMPATKTDSNGNPNPPPQQTTNRVIKLGFAHIPVSHSNTSATKIINNKK